MVYSFMSSGLQGNGLRDQGEGVQGVGFRAIRPYNVIMLWIHGFRARPC